MNRLLSLRRVCEMTSLGRGTVYALVKRGEFPAQIRVSSGRVAWIAEEIEQWIDWRITETRNRGPQNNSSTGDQGLNREHDEGIQ